VVERDGGLCKALHHDPRCAGQAERAHHICYRAHILKKNFWTVLPNGISLSNYCHMLAHDTHNKNLPKARLRAAVDAINLAQPEFPRPHFAPKGFVDLKKAV
jgi:hypothetical protein